ncbi:MAG TPA: ATP-binding protein, partial [Burkholderiales bacterium]|nr:ATP-binding protein [Burkholderiales bacterium]
AGLFVGSLRLRNKDPEVAVLIERVERALGSLEGVLEALLDISRLDAGVVVPRIERFPVARVLRRLQDTFAEPASQLSVELRIRQSAWWCESDPLILERVLANLLSNALRYCDKGRVLVGCRLRGEALCIEVRDNGPGIDERRHREIFREFVRLENAERLRDKGLGLGLAIVERLAHLLDHRIYVRSRKGEGATFGIVVPRVAPAHVAAQPLPAPAGRVDLAGKRILVVEDDEEVLAALGFLLAQHGAVPLLARTVAHALSLADSGPDLVIADDRLAPGEHRIPAIRLLRARFATGVPRIILADETLPSMPGGFPQPGYTVIRKPAGSGELLQAVAAALRAS